MNTSVNSLMVEIPHTIGHDISINRAVEMMREYNCHHLPVLDGGKLVGVISNSDIKFMNKVDMKQDLLVEDFMTEDCVVVDGKSSVKEAVTTMLDKKINSVIVKADDSHPWGIFTTTDALKFIINN